MKKTVLLIAFLSFSIANAQDWNDRKVVGNGNILTITKSTSDYDEIFASGSFSVELILGKEGTITITGDENILPYLKIDDDNGKLRVYLDKTKNYQYNSKLVITIPFKKLSNISFSGSGSMKSKDTIKTEHIEISVSGSGKSFFKVQSATLQSELSGSGNLILEGATDILNLNLIGSGSVEGSNLISKNAEISLSGSGEIKINCTNKLEIGVVGSGKVLYSGKPENISKNITGSGKIINQ